MKRFAQLFAELDESTSTEAKVEAMARYFRAADPRDAAWAVYFLAGGKPRQVVRTRELRAFALAASGLPEWLFEESYQAVGDLAETIALLLPPPLRSTELGLADWIETRLLPLRGRAPDEVLAALRGYADELDTTERFLLVKLIGGGFRVGVSRLLVTRALARVAGVDARLIAQRLVGTTDDAASPTAESFLALLAPAVDGAATRGGTPYPFFLAHPLPAAVQTLGEAGDWLAEWKYDGIRAQLVRRDGVWLWSRGEELITERFPEIAHAAAALPAGTVLDGEVLVWDEAQERPAPFARLQTRIARKAVTAKVLREHPACFVAYDLLEHGGEDWRARPQRERRAALQALLQEATVAGGGASREAASPRFAGLGGREGGTSGDGAQHEVPAPRFSAPGGQEGGGSGGWASREATSPRFEALGGRENDASGSGARREAAAPCFASLSGHEGSSGGGAPHEFALPSDAQSGAARLAAGQSAAAGRSERPPVSVAPAGRLHPALRLSPLLERQSWAELAALRAESRARGVEGLMLKHADSRYGVGRTRDVGTWWKWKLEPMTVDAVLVYAQRGHGRRASLYTDYTFAVWERPPRDAAEAAAVAEAIAAGEKPEVSAARGLPRLVPFAKAYSGLSDEEIRQVDALIRKSTVESFGPVRSVVPRLVFELGFEGIQESPRHRSGIAVRFPRMLRIRHDKPLHEADTLDSLRALLLLAGARAQAVSAPPRSDGDASR
jgi:DNA ligase-1